MTINEFYKMYLVSHQAVYDAIRRHEKELKDHITKNCNGVNTLVMIKNSQLNKFLFL